MSTKSKLLKVYVGETTRWQGKPVYRAILFMLKESGFAGVTVTRGVEGYGHLKMLHTTRVLELSADLPMVIDCVDTQRRSVLLFQRLRKCLQGAL